MFLSVQSTFGFTVNCISSVKPAISFFFMLVGVLLAYMSVRHMQRPEKTIRCLGMGVAVGCEPLSERWSWNLGPP